VIVHEAVQWRSETKGEGFVKYVCFKPRVKEQGAVDE